jgi:hypothetical protein
LQRLDIGRDRDRLNVFEVLIPVRSAQTKNCWGYAKNPKLNDLRRLALFGAVAAVNAESVVRTREGTAVRGTAAHTSDLSSSKDASRHPSKGQESRFRYSHFSASESEEEVCCHSPNSGQPFRCGP